MRKIERVLRVILLSVGILSFIGLGLNQWGSFISLGREQKEIVQHTEAVQSCMSFGTLHAVILEGKVYCYLPAGERTASLEFLKKNLEPQEIP